MQHDNKVTWLACWKENILNGVKYVMLSASSSFKGKSDMEKYDKVSQSVGRSVGRTSEVEGGVSAGVPRGVPG